MKAKFRYTVEPFINKHGHKNWRVKRQVNQNGTWAFDLREVVVTNAELYLIDVEYLFEGNSELARLREAGL